MSIAEARAYRTLSAALERHTGQTVPANRHWRIDMALKPLMRRNSVPDLQTLAALIEMDTDPKLTRACVEAMVNNETSFFRDQPNFALLAGPVLDHIRELRSDTKRLRIWSAACSTGQEPIRSPLQYWKMPKNGAAGQFRFCHRYICYGA
jgi:chemotaxis protein methyltransferase CheR